MKLWEKGYRLDTDIESFMTGDDPILDQALIFYDCIGSIAHAKMLNKIHLLTHEECQKLIKGLREIIQKAQRGAFSIPNESEDVHTAVENYLTQTLGVVGKKLHTARSRNDQILLDLRLYMRHQLLTLASNLIVCGQRLLKFAEMHQLIPMPGRTHFQHAMPSSMGLWAGAFCESFIDDLQFLKTVYDCIDQCPLGSCASYGVALPIDRQYVSDLLGFQKVQNNVLYANNSRGKFESIVLQVLVQVMNDLAKASTDIIYFSAPEFRYLTLPEKFCPGSSVMPQKRNPSPLELIRAKAATVQGFLFQTLEIIRALPSGYNQDFQETKSPLIRGFEVTQQSLRAFSIVVSELRVNNEICISACTPELFATDQALHLTQLGMPFRDAYRHIAANLHDVLPEDPVTNIKSKTHLGATGNLGLDLNLLKINELEHWVFSRKKEWEQCCNEDKNSA